MEILKHAHSGLRWVALGLLIYAIVNAFSKKGVSLYEKKDKMINLFTMILLHTQLLLGLILTFNGKIAFKDYKQSSNAFLHHGTHSFNVNRFDSCYYRSEKS